MRTLLLLGAVLLAAPLAAQVPGVAQLRNDPEQIRQRIAASGLSAQQIRDRLASAGYPTGLLDAFLPGTLLPASEPNETQWSALQALGAPFQLSADLLDEPVGTVPALPASRIFGLDVFRRGTTQFLPLVSGPVPSDYRLGPGDVLVLIITGEVELTHTLAVSREGFVVAPAVGQLYVTNLTLADLREALHTRLAAVYSGLRRGPDATTQFDIAVTNVRANQVFVVGEVAQPGAYQIGALGTVLTALYAAGGLTERGSLRGVQLRRDRAVVASLDLYEYLLTGETGADLRLENGDVVFVGIHGPQIDITGAVIRPGIYELREGDILADALQAAGGFRADAARNRLTIFRILPVAERGPGGVARSAISVTLVSDGDSVVAPPVAMRAGDSVVVEPIPALSDAYTVTIRGEVRRPDTYAWNEGMTVRDLLALARGHRVGADLREIEIARVPVDREVGELADVFRVALDSSYLGPRDAQGRFEGPPGPSLPPSGSQPEFLLAPFDQIAIYRQPGFEPLRTVVVRGEVAFPGDYALESKDARLSEAIRRAGGLLPTAHAPGARLIRPIGDAGRVDIRLTDALATPGGRDDIVLQPGDEIIVPEYVPTVRVEGAVNSPTSVLFRQGRGFDYYIDNAGGFRHDADRGRVQVRYANGEARVAGRFLLFRTFPDVSPGATITVPVEAPHAPFDATAFFGNVAQILASTVAIIVVATRL